MFIVSSISSSLEVLVSRPYFNIWNFRVTFFWKRFLGEISNNSPNDLLETNVYKTWESC